MKNIGFYLFFLVILSCNPMPPKVATKEKSMTTREQKKAGDFLIYDITTDTIMLGKTEYQDNVIFFKISGKIKNMSDKTFVKAIFEGHVKMKFDNKEIIDKNSPLTSFINNEQYLGMKDFYQEGINEFMDDDKWKPNQSYSFSFQTIGIDKIYANYLPRQIEYLLTLKAEDPVGYVFNDIVFHKDLKRQWLFKQ